MSGEATCPSRPRAFEKPLNDRRRNQIAQILALGQRLKGHSNYASVLQRRSAGIARINRRIHLQDHMRVDATVAVEIHALARNHAARDRNAIAADGKADHFHARVQGRSRAQFQRARVLKKIRVRNREHGQITVVGDVRHARFVIATLAGTLHAHRIAGADDVGVGDNPIAVDDKTRARCGPHRRRIPGAFVIKDKIRDADLDHRTICGFHVVTLSHGVGGERMKGRQNRSGGKTCQEQSGARDGEAGSNAEHGTTHTRAGSAPRARPSTGKRRAAAAFRKAGAWRVIDSY